MGERKNINTEQEKSEVWRDFCTFAKTAVPLVLSSAIGLGIVFISSAISVAVLERTLEIVKENAPRS